jgi:L-ascorbate metabolism protein UlaG (beta-lactamase superfamily)
MEAKFLGHAAALLSDGETTIIIDPFLTGNPQAKITAEDVEPDYIVLTHGHGDHVGDTVAIAKRTNATCIATYELALWLQGQGCDAHPMGIGGAFDFPFGSVRFTIAHHSAGAGELGDRYVGNPAGVIIDFGGKLIHHAGDTALTYDMKLIAERFEIDLAFLPIGSNFTMDIDDAVRATGFIQPKKVVPVHYNTWPPIAADPQEFAEKIRALTKAEPVILEPMESIEI